MKDVQLLVVDRTSLEEKKPRLCNVGESGEIYVRAGGLGNLIPLQPTQNLLTTRSRRLLGV